MNSNVFAEDLTNEQEISEEPPKYLVLPAPKKITLDGEINWAWDTEGYGTILKIQAGYNLWLISSEMFEDIESSYIYDLELADEQLQNCKNLNKSLQQHNKDTEKMYDILAGEKDKNERLTTIKIILASGGGLIVGAIGGALIGYLAAK